MMDPLGKLTTVQVDRSSSTEFVRFGTVGELAVLCSIFGDGFLCDWQKRRPRIGKSLILNLNDALLFLVTLVTSKGFSNKRLTTELT
jgi:hypothetical protein